MKWWHSINHIAARWHGGTAATAGEISSNFRASQQETLGYVLLSLSWKSVVVTELHGIRETLTSFMGFMGFMGFTGARFA